MALLGWSRKSEFTADRAGLLACRDRDIAVKAISKLSGIPKEYSSQISIDTLISHASEFTNMDTNVDKIINEGLDTKYYPLLIDNLTGTLEVRASDIDQRSSATVAYITLLLRALQKDFLKERTIRLSKAKPNFLKSISSLMFRIPASFIFPSL